MHAVPSGLLPPVHWPAAQTPVAHSPVDWQTAHALPFMPQLALSLPGLQVVPSQHPAHPFCGQVEPQPSSAPAHFPLQSATQSHFPFGLHRPFCGQSPHFPPQPSLPHTLPAQSGVQPAQLLPEQVEPLAEQSTQGAPPPPQALSAPPVRQLAWSALQQPGQVAGSQTHFTPTQRKPGPQGPQGESSGCAGWSVSLLRPSGGR